MVNMLRKLSKQGKDLLKEREGLKLHAYKDGGGVWTIGYGHTGNVKSDDRITERQASDLLSKDVVWAEDAVWSNYAPVNSLYQHEFDALVSFVYNVGEPRFKRSTLLRELNRGALLAVPQEMMRWNRVKGQRSEGLVNRRLSEVNQWVNFNNRYTV